MERISTGTARRSRLGLAGLLALAALALALAACSGSGGESGSGIASSSDAAGAALRAVVVYPEEVAGPSQPGLPLSVFLIEGVLPDTPTGGTVRTDEDCAPDEHGISRCRNEILLADGTSITVRHVHDMGVVPCLAPGEEVDVRAAA